MLYYSIYMADSFLTLASFPGEYKLYIKGTVLLSS